MCGCGIAVVLGIIAAVIASPCGGDITTPPRPDPIVIVAARPTDKIEKPAPIKEDKDEDGVRMTESYMSVTSLIGGRPVSKRVFLHGSTDGGSGNRVTMVSLEPVSSVRLGCYGNLFILSFASLYSEGDDIPLSLVKQQGGSLESIFASSLKTCWYSGN